MAGQFITHTTISGERWDNLAWQYYGDATLIAPIIQVNPQIPIEPVFEAGLVIGVPILIVDPDAEDQDDIPPWERP